MKGFLGYCGIALCILAVALGIGGCNYLIEKGTAMRTQAEQKAKP